MNIRNHIPNFITTLNLFAGSLGVIVAATGHLKMAAFLIFIAALFDFLDGTAARVLKAKSPIGKELDSLADVVSFGLLPGVILFMLMKRSGDVPSFSVFGVNAAACVALLIPVFSALRLAKFNLDTRQTDSFLGLPTPANAILIASFPLISAHQPGNYIYHLFINAFSNYYLLTILTLLLCWLLVSEIPLISLKVKNLKWADNKRQFILLALALILLITLGWAAIPVIIIAYFVISVAWPIR